MDKQSFEECFRETLSLYRPKKWEEQRGIYYKDLGGQKLNELTEALIGYRSHGKFFPKISEIWVEIYRNKPEKTYESQSLDQELSWRLMECKINDTVYHTENEELQNLVNQAHMKASNATHNSHKHFVSMCFGELNRLMCGC